MRINVTGNAGSGKTTVAKLLGARLGLPVFSLDSIVWLPGWTKRPSESRRFAEQQLVSGSEWVIDGVSSFVREHADLVLFLDVPTALCAWRGVTRAMRYFHRTRPELPPPCPDIVIVPRLLEIVFLFSSTTRSALLAEARAQPERFHVERRTANWESVLTRLEMSSHEWQE